ncbi:hypothetical protein, partial [Escherichia coli]|uniref:hypothetical protein n=1 Tax=Escherichia coli TaxID=562 RepID=UPI001E411B30
SGRHRPDERRRAVMAGATSSDSISAPSRSVRRAVPRNRIRIVDSPPGDIRVGAAVEHVVEHTAQAWTSSDPR